MSISYKFPDITNATITPNPVNMNTIVKLSVTVTEKTVVLTEEKIYSNETYSGER